MFEVTFCEEYSLRHHGLFLARPSTLPIASMSNSRVLRQAESARDPTNRQDLIRSDGALEAFKVQLRSLELMDTSFDVIVAALDWWFNNHRLLCTVFHGSARETAVTPTVLARISHWLTDTCYKDQTVGVRVDADMARAAHELLAVLEPHLGEEVKRGRLNTQWAGLAFGYVKSGGYCTESKKADDVSQLASLLHKCLQVACTEQRTIPKYLQGTVHCHYARNSLLERPKTGGLMMKELAAASYGVETRRAKDLLAKLLSEPLDGQHVLVIGHLSTATIEMRRARDMAVPLIVSFSGFSFEELEGANGQHTHTETFQRWTTSPSLPGGVHAALERHGKFERKRCVGEAGARVVYRPQTTLEETSSVYNILHGCRRGTTDLAKSLELLVLNATTGEMYALPSTVDAVLAWPTTLPERVALESLLEWNIGFEHLQHAELPPEGKVVWRGGLHYVPWCNLEADEREAGFKCEVKGSPHCPKSSVAIEHACEQCHGVFVEGAMRRGPDCWRSSNGLQQARNPWLCVDVAACEGRANMTLEDGESVQKRPKREGKKKAVFESAWNGPR